MPPRRGLKKKTGEARSRRIGNILRICLRPTETVINGHKLPVKMNTAHQLYHAVLISTAAAAAPRAAVSQICRRHARN